MLSSVYNHIGEFNFLGRFVNGSGSGFGLRNGSRTCWMEPFFKRFYIRRVEGLNPIEY